MEQREGQLRDPETRSDKLHTGLACRLRRAGDGAIAPAVSGAHARAAEGLRGPGKVRAAVVLTELHAELGMKLAPRTQEGPVGSQTSRAGRASVQRPSILSGS